MPLGHYTFNRLCEARDLLREVREPRLSIFAIAWQLRVSPFQLIRQFEALFGLTPHQFRIQSRLDQAKLLLARASIRSRRFAWRSALSAWEASATCLLAAWAQRPRPSSAARVSWCSRRARSHETFS